MAATYPLALCVDEPTFTGDPKAITAAEYTIINLNGPSWDDFVYQETITEGHPLRHEVPTANALVGDSDYQWRARLQDGDGNWTCFSEEGVSTFTQALLPEKGCLDCARVVTGIDGRFGVQANDTSSVYLFHRNFTGTVTPIWTYRAAVDELGAVTRTRIGQPSLTHSAGSDGTYAHDYLVKDNQLYILYATNIGSDGSEAIFSRLDLSDPNNVADSMSVIWWERDVTIQDEIRLVDTDNGFVAFIVVDEGAGDQLEVYQLDNGTWADATYPTGAGTWAPAVFDTLYNYSLISYQAEPATYIVFGVQNEATGVAVYRFDIQNATMDKVYKANPLPPANGSVPTFVKFLPGETIIRVLAAHYTSSAEVLSLSFDATDLSLVYEEVFPYILQEPHVTDAAGADPQPYVSTLIGLGNSKVLMVRSLLTTSVEGYAEMELFNYVADAGQLVSASACARTESWYHPGDECSGTFGELSLAAHMDQRFYSSSMVLIPVLRSPNSGTRHRWGGFVRGALLDMRPYLELLDQQEYGELIGAASDTNLESVGLRGDVGNDTIAVNIPTETALGGIKVSAEFDRADPAVWASSAWILIRELDYAFPLVVGDETGTWPIVMSDVGVSVGSQHGAFLAGSSTLTFEVFQVDDVVPAAADITYDSLTISVYAGLDSTTESCPLEEQVIDDFTTDPFSDNLDNDDETAWTAISGSDFFAERRATNYSGGNNVDIAIGGGTAVNTGVGSGGALVLQYKSPTDVDLRGYNTVRLTVAAFSGIGNFDTAQPAVYFKDSFSQQQFVEIPDLIDKNTSLPEAFYLDLQVFHIGGVIDMSAIRECTIAFSLVEDNLPISCTLDAIDLLPQVEVA